LRSGSLRSFPTLRSESQNKDGEGFERPRGHFCGQATALSRAFWGGANRFGFKLVHYSVQGNHVHLLVEAQDDKALSRGMNGLGVRVAKGLNRVMRRHGKVLDDRYHGHSLRTPTEVYTSTVAVIEPDTFLMRRLC
jgi:REP element-mobilizing transposase RayT